LVKLVQIGWNGWVLTNETNGTNKMLNWFDWVE
jgi:hypothetical protein